MAEIPPSLIGTTAQILEKRYTHAELNALFQSSGFPGDPPEGNKLQKCQSWMRYANKQHQDALTIFGTLIAELMDAEPVQAYVPWLSEENETKRQDKDKNAIRSALKKEGLEYVRGGKIFGSQLSIPSKSLAERIASEGSAALEVEYQRAYKYLNDDPDAAVSAACSILETVCKDCLESQSIDIPKTQTLSSLWTETCKHLDLDPSKIEDNDLRQILTGLFSVSKGIGSLRTHASSAHGRSESQRKRYKVTPRHARLAVHSAHTLALFIIETAEQRRKR